MPDLPSGTVSFLFTDVEGSTQLLQELGADAYAAALADHRRLLREAFARHGGVEVDTQGDAFFVAFPTAPGALAAAREAQQALAAGPIRVRMGLHTGTPLLTEQQYVGVDVHRTARIAAAGHGGQVLVSAATYALVDPSALRDLGEHRLKDLAAPERLWQLGEEEFPPLKTLYRTNLPVPATPFLGREHELQEVVALLEREDVRLLTLTGPGGTGKTRLALQAAAEAAGVFPDGLTWVGLSPLRDPALFLPVVAQALQVKEEPGRPIADTLVAQLSGRRLLLLIDNAEHLLPQAADAVARLQPSGVTLLVTSRERLQLQGEQVWAVPPLGEEDGVALFSARARALDASFRASATVRELCERLDNLPLALELAAARTPLFTPGQLLERLGQRLDLLTGGRDADPRQQTLRATIAWSYDLLNSDERRLFCRLAVFVGGCSYEAAERVCEADPDTLQSLLDKSLLRRRDTELGRPRYWMLETIREFAAERLQESEEAEELPKRHADYFLRLAEETEPALHGPEQAARLDQLDTEQGNLRAALGSGPPDRRLGLAASLSWFWQLRSYLGEGLSWLEGALDEVEEPTINRARALDGAGRLAFYSGYRGPDRRLLEESVELMQTLGDERGLAQSLAYLGIVAGVGRDPATARTAGENAVTTSRAAGDDWTQALALWGLGTNYVLGRCGPPDNEAGAPLLEESAALFRRTGDKWGLAGPLLYLARIAHRSGDLDVARQLMSESAFLLREVGDKFRLNLALHGLGDIATSRGDGPGAQAFYADALEVSREMGRTEPIADAQLKLALAALGRGDTQEARKRLGESLDGYTECGTTEGMLWVLEGFALVAAQSGNRQRAATLLGASEGRDQVGGGIRLDPAGRERVEADLRAQLGAERFEAACAQGRTLTLEDALEYALAGEIEV
jgi:predicted ATPase/class 3 adenylate cyclase